MLIGEELTACLCVFLGMHNGLGCDMRRLVGLLRVYQSTPLRLGELSCVSTLVPTKSSTSRWARSPGHPQRASCAAVPQAAALLSPLVPGLLACCITSA